MGLLFYFVLVLLLLLLMWRCEYPVWFCSGCVLQYGFGHMIDTGFDFVAIDVALCFSKENKFVFYIYILQECCKKQKKKQRSGSKTI